MYSMFRPVQCTVCLFMYSLQYVCSYRLYSMFRPVRCTVCLLMYTVQNLYICTVYSMFVHVYSTVCLVLYSAQFVCSCILYSLFVYVHCTVFLFMYIVFRPVHYVHYVHYVQTCTVSGFLLLHLSICSTVTCILGIHFFYDTGCRNKCSAFRSSLIKRINYTECFTPITLHKNQTIFLTHRLFRKF